MQDGKSTDPNWFVSNSVSWESRIRRDCYATWDLRAQTFQRGRSLTLYAKMVRGAETFRWRRWKQPIQRVEFLKAAIKVVEMMMDEHGQSKLTDEEHGFCCLVLLWCRNRDRRAGETIDIVSCALTSKTPTAEYFDNTNILLCRILAWSLQGFQSSWFFNY